jgi:iron-sulfur cluster repair protein YtfE (RIC family)
MVARSINAELEEEIQTGLIRDLVEKYPNLMEVLSPYGFDLCCGGGHSIPEAARLHGLDAGEILARVKDSFDLSLPTS